MRWKKVNGKPISYFLMSMEYNVFTKYHIWCLYVLLY